MQQKNPNNVSGGSQIFGWCMYDWANSAYVTTVVAGVLPIYFATAIVSKGGVPIGNTFVSADALWGYLISASAMFVFLFAPVLGAISDFSASKKKFLITLAYIGQHQRNAPLLLSIRRCMANRHPISDRTDWVCGGKCLL